MQALRLPPQAHVRPKLQVGGLHGLQLQPEAQHHVAEVQELQPEGVHPRPVHLEMCLDDLLLQVDVHSAVEAQVVVADRDHARELEPHLQLRGGGVLQVEGKPRVDQPKPFSVLLGKVRPAQAEAIIPHIDLQGEVLQKPASPGHAPFDLRVVPDSQLQPRVQVEFLRDGQLRRRRDPHLLGGRRRPVEGDLNVPDGQLSDGDVIPKGRCKVHPILQHRDTKRHGFAEDHCRPLECERQVRVLRQCHRHVPQGQLRGCAASQPPHRPCPLHDGKQLLHAELLHRPFQREALIAAVLQPQRDVVIDLGAQGEVRIGASLLEAELHRHPHLHQPPDLHPLRLSFERHFLLRYRRREVERHF
eukprot:Sspe_Gene.61020::Locus_33755_Transcript_1_1_Confidence_1.000_Length_4231::g.61020::m.61020